MRAGFKSRAEAVSEQGYDAGEIDREIAADNARADDWAWNTIRSPKGKQ